ncbi:MAG: hypothetical protein JWQ71_4942 [Pedosphaera sp.]|nr:hypothetical protein [Pedosphaera sp.]
MAGSSPISPREFAASEQTKMDLSLRHSIKAGTTSGELFRKLASACATSIRTWSSRLVNAPMSGWMASGPMRPGLPRYIPAHSHRLKVGSRQE